MKQSENNLVKLVGNICGNMRVLRKRTDENGDIRVSKLEIIFIPNDYWDSIGRPNSLRLHAYNDVAENILDDLGNGDRVAFTGHLKRTIVNQPQSGDKGRGSSDFTPKYGLDVVVDEYELLRRRALSDNDDGDDDQ